MRRARPVLMAAVACGLLTLARPASAQTAGAGPLVLEPLSSGFVVAPDVKIARINGQTETLAGGYAAHVHDRHLLFGGAGYWLANAKDSRDLGYGGGLGGWIFRPDSVVSFTAKGLAGVGWLSDQTVLPFDARFDDDRHVKSTVASMPSTVRYRFRRQFFIAEPEFDVQVTINQHLRITAGGSYRLVDLQRGLDDLAQGPSASISAQFKFGK